MSSPGAPTRDVLLVSAIITVSLSVTVVLCGLCHWCQRKLVRLLRAPGGTRPGPAPRPPRRQARERSHGRAPTTHLPTEPGTRGNSHRALCVCWGLVPYVCVHTQSHTPRHTLVDRQGSHGHSHARDYAHTCRTSRRKDCRHTVLKGAWWPLGSGPRGICPFSSLGLRHGAPTYTVPMATALPSPRPSVIGQGEKCGTLTSLPPSSIWGMEGVC